MDCSNFGLEAFLFDQGEGRETVLMDFSVTNTSQSGSGGGIVISNASPTLLSMRIFSNRAQERGLCFFVTQIIALAPSFFVSLCLLFFHVCAGRSWVFISPGPEGFLSALPPFARGGLPNPHFAGGGLYVEGPFANPLLQDLRVDGNSAAMGGGLFVTDGARPDIVLCSFT